MTDAAPSAASRIAVVTGASSGIGAATARQLAEAGYRVVLTARRKDRIEALAEELTAAGHSVTAYPLDVTDRAAVDEFASAFRTIGVLVNNAGGALGADPVATGDPSSGAGCTRRTSWAR
ncbi:putative oxidoreductase [Streptomyces sp. MBT84]|nr:putative oxidoreductase [Streptomyces sp. MBT84]